MNGVDFPKEPGAVIEVDFKDLAGFAVL
jgi:hypothetical protein